MSRNVCAVLFVVILLAAASAGAAPVKRLEIFSWWTAGGEAEGLHALFEVYKRRHPDV